MEYVPARKAREILGLSDGTLRHMDQCGDISVIRTPGGKRLYNVQKFIRERCENGREADTRKRICYCRVSSANQRPDLQRQVDYLQSKYPTHEIIKDIGSGLNFKRKGLKTILDYAYKGILGEVVVAYKDRLCRFGFDLLEHIFKTQSNADIVVLNQVHLSPEEELSRDILQILTIFSARMHGLRKYKIKIHEDQTLSHNPPEESTEDVIGDIPIHL